jgi:hypothetical protein
MSSENLSYLGYEDLNDFTSQHSDFANLLVNKEGYIYKFQNFSWIDFILYSGSPNKAALLKQKNGEETEIKLSVKEVFLTSEINGNQKYYSVRIISDNFVNMASKVDPEITKKSPPKNSFNLNNLISEDAIESSPNHQQEDTITLSSPSITESASEKSDDFILNFPTQESIEEQSVIKLDLTQEPDNSLLNSTEEVESPIFEQEFKLNIAENVFDEPLNSETEPKSVLTAQENPLIKDEEINFDLQKHETFESPTNENISSGFSLKHTTTATSESENRPEVPINLNFLHTEEPMLEPEKVSEVTEDFKEETNLSFLKQATRHEVNEPEEMKNKQEIISQIQHDIEEIDAYHEETTQAVNTESQESSEVSAYMFNQNEVKQDKKSFTKTLKSLFSEPQESQKEERDFMLEPAASLKKNDEIVTTTPKEERDFEDHTPTFFSTLGLDKEEGNSLILEFIADTRQNIQLFKQYHQSKQSTQANYALIKIQSSAEILNLNDIINTIHSIKQSVTQEESSHLEELIERLEEDVAHLSLHVESETV